MRQETRCKSFLVDVEHKLVTITTRDSVDTCVPAPNPSLEFRCDNEGDAMPSLVMSHTDVTP